MKRCDSADVAVLAARGAHAILNRKCDIGRLARRLDDVRIGARPGDVHKRAKRRQILLARGEHRLGVVGDGDKHRDVAGAWLLAHHLRRES